MQNVQSIKYTNLMYNNKPQTEYTPFYIISYSTTVQRSPLWHGTWNADLTYCNKRMTHGKSKQ